MLYIKPLTNEGDWRFEIAIDLRQWVIGFNVYEFPWPMWNVFVGPLRIGAYRDH